MKTSNKLILAVFLLAVLLPLLVVATVLVRYRSGNFTWQKDGADDLIKLSYTGGQHLTLRAVNQLTIYPSDSLYITIEPHFGLHVKEKLFGDSVLLYGDSSYNYFDTLKNGVVENRFVTDKSNDEVALYLPPGFMLRLEGCENVRLHEPGQGKPVENISLHLHNTELLTRSYYENKPTPIQSLSLTMEGAMADLSHLPPVTDLDISAGNNSKVSISGLEVRNIRVAFDSSSVLTATGQQLKKIIQKK